MSEELETLKESAKAAQEVAKTAGKGIDAAEKFGSFISGIVGGTLEQGMGIWKDKLKYKRYENQLIFLDSIEKKKQELGIDNHQVENITMKLGIPLFEGASLEDNTYLQDLWANLTINSINKESGFSLERSYIFALEQITELEARILITIYSEQNYENGLLHKIETAKLPESIVHSIDTVDFTKNLDDAIAGKVVETSPPEEEPSTDIKLALSNLARLQCIKLVGTFGEEMFSVVHPTLFGERLHNSVTLTDPQ